jgi:ferredoxin-thioredoxin reductase catalytic subunit
MTSITIDQVRKRAEADAQTYGYHLTPDPELLQMFFEGLKTNEERYGYPSCPCRLASGKFEYDRDIICPCDYRDPDVQEFGACYCRLYVSKEVYESKQLPSVPERRPIEKQARSYEASAEAPKAKPEEAAPPTEIPKEEAKGSVSKAKLWYCKQCGYVVYRDDPPYVCPICKAKREMFAELKTRIDFLG